MRIWRPAAGGRLSMEARGMRISPYQIFLRASMRAFTANPEFQSQPPSGSGFTRSISRSNACVPTVPPRLFAPLAAQSDLSDLAVEAKLARMSIVFTQVKDRDRSTLRQR